MLEKETKHWLEVEVEEIIEEEALIDAEEGVYKHRQFNNEHKGCKVNIQCY